MTTESRTHPLVFSHKTCRVITCARAAVQGSDYCLDHQRWANRVSPRIALATVRSCIKKLWLTFATPIRTFYVNQVKHRTRSSASVRSVDTQPTQKMWVTPSDIAQARRGQPDASNSSRQCGTQRKIMTRKIQSLFVFSDRNPEGPGAPWGPRHDLLIQKILTIIQRTEDFEGGVKQNQTVVKSHPAHQPSDNAELMTSRLLVECPLQGFPMDLKCVKFFPFDLEEGRGVAAVEFKTL